MFKLNNYQSTNINEPPDVNSAQISEKFPMKEQLKLEQTPEQGFRLKLPNNPYKAPNKPLGLGLNHSVPIG
ncbi:hypothetical protein DdX_20501 [Ditylenchus destructor]|uniref:Uncharacterized protein n=1 Tax=Ditylenchus destructor TaxID=166010 RepID=A0AAD4MHZ0_9BILA|nr:hypothetical protein DdX_20501 [Ditylenchus destructor]